MAPARLGSWVRLPRVEASSDRLPPVTHPVARPPRTVAVAASPTRSMASSLPGSKITERRCADGRHAVPHAARSEHRRVQTRQAEARRDGLVDAGHVAVAEQDLRPCSRASLPVDQVEHPGGTVAAARGPDGGEPVVTPRRGEVAGSQIVGAGEERCRTARAHAREQRRFEPERTGQVLGEDVVARLQRRRRGDHGHLVAGTESGGTVEGRGAHAVATGAVAPAGGSAPGRPGRRGSPGRRAGGCPTPTPSAPRAPPC